MNFILIVIGLISITQVQSELSEEIVTTFKPSHFIYHAGRYPGHVDRIHEETNDGTGRVKGFYTFIDPKHRVRTVEYTADKEGFHPRLINYDEFVSFPVDSEAVRLEKERHFRLYEKIANANRQGVPQGPPRDTASVSRAKENHYQLFNKIAQEHAAIAMQREAERAAYEATSVANDVHPD